MVIIATFPFIIPLIFGFQRLNPRDVVQRAGPQSEVFCAEAFLNLVADKPVPRSVL